MTRRRGARFKAWSRSAPSPDTRSLSGTGPPPNRREVGGHYSAFGTTTSRLTPRKAWAGVSLAVIASPTDRAALSGPGLTWTTGHQPPAGALAHLGLLGPYEVSPDHPDGVVAVCQPQPPPDAPTTNSRSSCSARRPDGGVIGFPVARSVATPGGLPAVHSRSSPRLCLRPLQTPGHPDALDIGYSNFNGQSSGRTLTSSSSELLGVHATRAPRRSGAPSVAREWRS